MIDEKKIKTLSKILDDLLDLIEYYLERPTVQIEASIREKQEETFRISKTCGGKILEHAKTLNTNILLFLQDLKGGDEVLKNILILKNDLWAL